MVLDASVGVKWFKEEAGTDRADEIYLQAVKNEAVLVAPMHFAHEVLSVVGRHGEPQDIVLAWHHLNSSGLSLVPLSDELVSEAAEQCARLGCTFYDALAPACASLLEATLVSADARAHGAFPDVVLIE